ncbi:MAG: CRTAC1 family protein [Candidatus Latescibacteria bacterium]|nr:CRTAC1 family protein [Candidatus Latescibacterota bacterium]
MARSWTRRQRLVFRTALISGLAVLAVAAALIFRPAPAQYVPGEKMEGLTEDLARAIPPNYVPVKFSEVAGEAGIDFQHFHGQRSGQLPEDMGSGAAWGDYDRDGDPDLYIVNEAGPLTMNAAQIAASPAHSALYRNEGQGHFAEVSRGAGVEFRGCGQGASWADYDGDGHLDLCATSYGENQLYHNQGGGAFAEVGRQAGIGGTRGFWSGASWGDYDRDGDLDLYICGYVQYRYDPDLARQQTKQYNALIPATLNPSTFAPERNLLYRNQGDGTFAEVAEALGVDNLSGRSLSASWADFDEDGWLDLYVANDVSDNALFHNKGKGVFEDISHPAWVADYRGAMGLAVGDWNGDGDQDIYITHWIAQENALYDNLHADNLAAGQRAPLRFMDAADRYGLGQSTIDYVGWGTAFVDFDRDGRPDLLSINGSTFEREDNRALLVPMKSQLFWNGGPQEGFYEVGAASGPAFAGEHVGRGLAVADYDGDGDADALVVVNGGKALLWRNEGAPGRHWLKMRLQGQGGNRQGFGARVRLVAGGRAQCRQVGATSSYLSQHAVGEEFFGLGAATQVDTLQVVWAGGKVQTLTHLPTDQRVEVTEAGRADR